MQTIKKAKLNLKNCTFAHLLESGDLVLYYQEKHKISGKQVDWNFTVKREDLPFSFMVCHSSFSDSAKLEARNYRFRSICLHGEIIPFLNDLKGIELWPNNQGSEASHKLLSVYLRFKNGGNLSLDTYTIDGKKYGGYPASVVY